MSLSDCIQYAVDNNPQIRVAQLQVADADWQIKENKAIGYPAGNALADAARAKGLNGIIYPSVRHSGGTCIAALFPHAVQSVAQGDVYRMTWRGSSEPEIEKVAT